jgi:rod shape-determining protein MreD
MIYRVLKFGLFLILVLLVQVLLFNNIQFSGYINPYIYLMFILVLPEEIPAWLLLMLAFLTGIIMDVFSHSPGMHTSATVMAGFIRPYVLKIISPRDGYEGGRALSIHLYGFRWFIMYILIMVLVHHTVLFYIEVFRFTDFFRTLSRVLLSSLFTTFFILLIDYYRKRD